MQKKKLLVLKKKYFKLVKKAKKLFFDSNSHKTKLKNLPSSKYWKLGNLFSEFYNDVNNNFIITNYNEALERDFGRSSVYIRELIIFSKLFEENEISDFIPMVIYRALVWKKNQLNKNGILKKEKKRLMNMGKNKKCPSREVYKIELINAIKSAQLKS